MDGMNITFAQYYESNGERLSISATIDGKQCSVPFDSDNRHYAEIMRQVEAGELTIQDADD